MYLLDNPVRPYAWGSRTAIPELLGVPPAGKPQAELWIGAHPSSPSTVADGRSLVEVIAATPELELGPDVVAEFGARLPFLLKVLAAEEPLSLQAHPDADQAREGFAREDAAGIPIDAPHRSYRDAYGKRELLIALTRFEALAGFRPPEQTLRIVQRLDVPELTQLFAPLSIRRGEPAVGMAPADDKGLAGGVETVFTALMYAPAAVRADLVGATLEACRELVGRAATPTAGRPRDDLPLDDAQLLLHLARFHPGDRGIVAALLLNHVVLEPGEGIYLPPRTLHSYIRGMGVELLANSDNVLRGGLTIKHVDVPELLHVLDFTPGQVDVIRAGGKPAGVGLREEPAASTGHETVYPTPAREFRLSWVEVDGAVELAPRGAQILLCVDGAVHARSSGGAVELTRGRSVYAGAYEGALTLRGVGTLFRATAGL